MNRELLYDAIDWRSQVLQAGVPLSFDEVLA